jgi:catechol 2,3-dioxygenase-like lactoylglutathione lyase family enzyme
VWTTTEPLPSTAYFAVTEDPEHVGNSNRIAFWVSSETEVDRVTEIAASAGAVDLSGPKTMPYGPGYYASFFSDPSGNRLEVYIRPE